jgi:hypothetical protein
MRIAGEINTAFKVAIIERWGTQIECERETGIRQGSLSQLQRNYRAPYPVELVRLRKFFPMHSCGGFSARRQCGRFQESPMKSEVI